MLDVRNPSQLIEDQQKILQQVAKLARSPVGLASMIEIGLRHSDLIQGREETPPPARRHGAVWNTGIGKATEKAISSLQGDFTAAEVVKRLTRDGYRFAVKNKREAVGKVLRKLRAQGKIEEVKKGTGGALTIYRSAS